MALWSLDSGLYESPRLDRFVDVYYLCHKVNKGYKGGIWRLLNLNHHLVQFFPHSVVGERGVCWHKYGTPIYSFKLIPLIACRATCSLLSLPTSSTPPFPHQQSLQKCELPCSHSLHQQPLDGSVWQD